MLNASGVCAPEKREERLDTQKRNSCIHAPGGQMPLAVRGRDTEAGMLSGISRKRKIRSNLYWFTEFCNSQCLSHFAAPFIVVRAETSVAESCKQLFQWGSPLKMMLQWPKHKGSRESSATGAKPEDSPTSPCYPRVSKRGHRCEHLHPRPEPHKRNAQWFVWMRANDPSAGSPTETLLRLLLPLSDKVH